MEAWVIGTARIPVEKHFAKNWREIAQDLIVKACEDGGIRVRDLDGLVVTPPSLGSGLSFMWAAQLAQMLGIRGGTLTLVENGGGTSLQAVRVGLAEILLKRARRVAILGMDERRYDQGGEVTVALYEAVTSQMMLYGPYLGLLGVGAPIPLYAMAGQNYMEKYGVTPEDLAEVVLYQREHAFHQPDALFYQKKVSREEILQSPILSPPLRLHDCSTFVSGGACVILSFQPEGPSPVQIAGYGEYHGGDHFIPLSDPLERFPSVEKAFEEARESAGLSPEELEVVEIYDVFSPTHLVILEELSLAKRGRAIEKVREGKFTYGSYPVVNPTGGRIGFGHPAGATPLISLVEVVRQIGGKSNGKKIDPPPKTGLVQAEHGMLNGCYILIVKEGNL